MSTSSRRQRNFSLQKCLKEAKQDAEESVAEVLKSLGYLSDLGKLAIFSTKTFFLCQNSAIVQMLKSVTHSKKGDLPS